jgi:hypothetical protein
MNRLHRDLQAANPRMVLSAAMLAEWSLEDFVFARKVARAPMAVSGGLASARIVLDFALPQTEHAVVALPLYVGDQTVELHAGNTALDALAGLLEPGKSNTDAGRTLSLDAVEALFCALLSPLSDVQLGDARWTQGENAHGLHAICALHLDGHAFLITGSQPALMAFHSAFASKVDRLVAAPLCLLKNAERQTPAVEVDLVLGAVTLDAKDLEKLGPQGAVLLDSHWAGGKTVAARRFMAAPMEEDWSLAGGFEDNTLLVRSARTILALDTDNFVDGLAVKPLPNHPLQLVRGDQVLAHGKLTALTCQGEPRMAFVIDTLFD